MTEEYRALTKEGPEEEFSIVRKGFDPAEVELRLAEYRVAFRDMEQHVARLTHELNEARHQIARLEAAEGESVENAMAAVFDAKDRILNEAKQRARTIEEEAYLRVGQPVPGTTVPGADDPAEASTPDSPNEAATDGKSQEHQAALPDDVMARMIEEAEQIKDRLEGGLSAAFDHMAALQNDAETRARELLAEARLEAARLRAAAGDSETEIEVSLNEGERLSHYSRRSAALPRLNTEGGESVLAEMADLRARFRGDDAAAPTQDAAG